MQLNMINYMRYCHLVWKQRKGDELTKNDKKFIDEIKGLVDERQNG